MKFNKVDEDKLQIILNKDDLQQRDIVKWDLLPHNAKAQKIFSDILQEAYDACGFEVKGDTQLMIEAFPITNDSMLINVTKIDKLDDITNMIKDNLANFSEKLLNDIKNIDDEDLDFEDIGDEIYYFKSLDDVIDLSVRLKDYPTKDSVLYKYKDGYFLHLTADDASILTIEAILSEYGNVKDIAVEFLDEHAEVIIKTKALESLALVG